MPERPAQAPFGVISTICLGRPATLARTAFEPHTLSAMAEGVGFEPTVGLTQRSISSRVP
jgi:hypothetical protein